jgi:hypothetical protein
LDEDKSASKEKGKSYHPMLDGALLGGRPIACAVYGWFTEGLDTRVLQDAKALLDQWGQRPAGGGGPWRCARLGRAK